MKPLETRPPTAVVPAMPEFRDWGNLPELPLSEVLRRVLPCLRSVYAFAAVCRPWRRLLRASAANLLRPGMPPFLLNPFPRSRAVGAFSQRVLERPLPYRADLAAEGAILLSASRGHLLLLPCRGLSEGEPRIIIIDALTGADRREIVLPSPRFACHYAALLPTHLLVFHSKHAFFSLPFPDPNPDTSSSGPHWTKHSLPRPASFVTGILEFRGRVLGLTDRAQLLEFRLCASPQGHTVQMLPAAGLPDATTFDRWHFGPRLVAAGDRLLLVLFKLEPKSGSLYQDRREVKKVAIYGLDMARMRWEEVENIGAYSIFVDCAGKSAAACMDVGSCGVEENRVYVVATGRRWRSFPPGWEAPLGDANNGPFSRFAMGRQPWPSKIWVYPPLFF
ncbi:hypothetical protein SEVIR_1G289300v4 [Setaria viridis]|uniref:KIB1-4 beta-propeller domain-containing protein n=1 Tax=Setaria viridis TaxID=4556 RepID=A0A4U6WEL9_SETVI|nr:uncharacterized protein LOC101764225 [Setaria italica]XP_034569666.1 uncharacterized protein LOC117834145 [Setaria viridis]TKW41062.1 hypothetical protein SEVIR_1G289300v2 [Setaria viridis]